MVDVTVPLIQPEHWRVQGVLMIFAFVFLLAMNWSAVLVTAQDLNKDAHDCRTKLGKAADRVVSFVFDTGSQCKSQQSDPLPLGIP